MHSRVGALSKFFFIDLLGSVAWFPVWWYTTGLFRVVRGSIHVMQYRWREYGLSIWIKNFFVPMYGEYDWAGRFISVFVRAVVILGRLIAFAIEGFLYLVGILAWIVVPIVSVLLIVLNGARSLVPGASYG